MGSLPYFLDCPHDVALFVLCKGPVTVGVVSTFIVLFGFLADEDCLTVKAMHVVQECYVVICVWVLPVHCHTFFQILKRLVVHFSFEVRQAKVVLQLRIVTECFSFIKNLNSR